MSKWEKEVIVGLLNGKESILLMCKNAVAQLQAQICRLFWAMALSTNLRMEFLQLEIAI